MVEPRFSLLLLRGIDGRYLFQLRDEHAPKFPNQWACFGGGVKPEESFEEGLQREIWEELRYRVQAPRLLGYFRAEDYGIEVDPAVTGVRAYFVEEYDTSQTLEQHEGKGMGWFTLQMALTLSCPTHHRQIVHHLIAKENLKENA